MIGAVFWKNVEISRTIINKQYIFWEAVRKNKAQYVRIIPLTRQVRLIRRIILVSQPFQQIHFFLWKGDWAQSFMQPIHFWAQYPLNAKVKRLSILELAHVMLE